ncbi:MAG: lantibiotic dehydratase [Frankiaceae bacterium]
MTHLVPLGDTGWSVWRSALLRSAGFPVDGLLAFAAPECAAAADAVLAGDGAPDAGSTGAALGTALELATEANAGLLCEIAADPLLREAITWQNPEVLVALDRLVAAGPSGPRNVRRRDRENALAGYWQRYVAKAETIGFFGPVCWGTVEPGADGLDARPGPALVRHRRVFLEHWALDALGDRLAADPEIRRWFAPVLPPHHAIDGQQVLRPAQPPVPVPPLDAEVLRRCDGRRPAVAVVEELVRDGRVRRPDDGYLVLANLVERGLLRWDADLPQGLGAELVLRRRLAAIGDPAVRERALAALDRLSAARERVAAAAGEPYRLAAALAGLDAEFTGLTGLPPRRRPGQAYAGRALCHEEAARDLDFVLGAGLLDALAPALALPLQAARWLTGALVDAHEEALRELHADLASERADEPVRLGELWILAQGAFFGSGPRPLDRVAAELAERWARVLRLADAPAGASRLTFTAAELAPRVAAEFPATHPGWSAGRIHSPDLQLGAESAAALRRGELVAVLGELHCGWPTFDAAILTEWHPDVEELRRALAADLGPHRLRPLYPPDYPRTGGRLAHSLAGPTDQQLAFADAPGADRDRLLPAVAAVVREVDGALVVDAPDGRRRPLVEAFSALLAMHAAEAFKVLTDRPHAPRITVDRLVLARETWRLPVAASGLVEPADGVERYLAVRRWRAALGLPERVFVRLATETKPTYVDLTSPAYVTRLCRMARAAQRTGGDGVPMVVTELLPDLGQAWLPDAGGRRYVSELRLQVRDPEPVRPRPAPAGLLGARSGDIGTGGAS